MHETPPSGRKLATADVALIALNGPDEGAAIALLPGALTIGRFAPSDVIIDSRLVSKCHARLRRAGDHLVIDDLKAPNGTFVNGARVQTSQALRDGDLVSIAGIRQYRVRIAPNDRAASAPIAPIAPPAAPPVKPLPAAAGAGPTAPRATPARRPEETIVRARDVSVHLQGPHGDFLLRAGAHVVGRQPDVAVFLNDRQISRTHAVITIAGLRVMLEDRDSANGTTVNDELLKGSRALRSGDTVKFGELAFNVTVKTGP